jgi:hypothetical protein
VGKIRNARRGAYKAQRVIKPAMSLGVLRWCLPLCRAVALLSVMCMGAFGYLGAWQKTDQWIKFDGFVPANLEILAVSHSRRGSAWLGAGRVDGVPTEFKPRELNAVLGSGPSGAQDPVLAQVRARLPITMAVLWHPDASERLLPAHASKAHVRAQQLSDLRVAASFLGVAIVSIGLSIWLGRQMRRAQMQTQRSHGP